MLFRSLAVLTILFLFGETKGDFANGILFFIDTIFNINTIVLLIILFGLTYFFGAIAGKEIIIEKKNTLLITFKYVILISLSITIYTLIAGFIREKDLSNDLQNLLSSHRTEIKL